LWRWWRACAPTNLGVRAFVPYDEDEHPESAADHKIVNEIEEVERIPKMMWYMYKVGSSARYV
jgi:hypothetical protein